MPQTICLKDLRMNKIISKETIDQVKQVDDMLNKINVKADTLKDNLNDIIVEITTLQGIIDKL